MDQHVTMFASALAIGEDDLHAFYASSQTCQVSRVHVRRIEVALRFANGFARFAESV